MYALRTLFDLGVIKFWDFFFSGCDGSELEKEEKLVFLKLGCCHFNLL